ncbi:HIT domain-containing protein [Candidatus Woesearchaeota archaeon]|nr:HIT domain-containing protein [Candidatus Woesearchaeota archaeon]
MDPSEMSPEELYEYQKQQCIFCKIISGEVQSKKIYEDEKTLAILDINPASEGHIIVLPKNHYQIMPQIPEKEIGHLFNTAKKLSQSLLQSFQTKGTTIFVANGAAAGQKAPHFMIHVMPRKENDALFTIKRKEVDSNKLLEIQNILIGNLSKMFGREVITKKEPEPQKEDSLPEIKESETKEEEGGSPHLDSVGDFLLK